MSITAHTARGAAAIRETFGRYLTDAVVASILETPEGLKLGGERRKVTILMSDLRGFSGISEQLPPEKVVLMLNIYLGAMADVIMEYQGTIDEFIGDAILVLFGAPTLREDDAARAVACAIAMQLAMEKVNAQCEELGLPRIEMGIGINTGGVVVGNIGSAKRAKYGVVGSQVNLTGRIESYTVGGQILISEATWKEVAAIVRTDGQIEVEPKGAGQRITLYEAGGIGDRYNLFLPEKIENFVPLPEEIPLWCTLLKGKHAGDDSFSGRLIKLGENSAEVELDRSIATMSDLKINFPSLEQNSTNLYSYAKVTRRMEPGNRFTIRFTSVPPLLAEMLHKLAQMQHH